MKNFARKFLSVTLAAMMLFSMLPTVAFAANSSDDFYRIVHLDNGRKYYSKEWIIALINEMAEAGFNQLQLAFGNDGMRFLLDDMEITVDGTTYSSAAVKKGIQKGNAAYHNEDVNELTEDEMDEILAHADSMGIDIVPHMNMPGHMDAILDAIEYVDEDEDISAHFTGYSTSVRSLNLNDDNAVAFTLALLEKYVAYFADNGCKFFHIGADEFGNDAYGGSMGFPSMGSVLYAKFAKFVNDAAAIVKDAGMTPRAWNDGISYGNGNSQSTTSYSEVFDTDIQVTYWSSGWGSGYAVAPASRLASNGHDMINTNGDYYYILGVNDIYTSGTSTTHEGYDYTAAEGFKNTTFMGTSGLEGVGSMFCIWGDVPGAETETEVAKYVRPILRVMGARMNDSNSYEVESIVSGGFNADGTINVPVEEPEIPANETITDPDTGVVITAPGLESVTIDFYGAESDEESAWITYDITVAGSADAEYYVDMPFMVPYNEIFDQCDLTTLTADVDGDPVTGLAVVEVEGETYFTGVAPHFSELTVRASVMPAAEVDGTTITLEAGESTTATITGYNYANETPVVADGNVVKAEIIDGKDSSTGAAQYGEADVSVNDLISSNNTNWVDTGYYYKEGNNYYKLYAKRSGKNTRTFTWGYGSNQSEVEQLGTQQVNRYYVSYTEPNITVYEQTSSGTTVPASTTVKFTGLNPGTTTVTVGTVTYEVTVVSDVVITINYLVDGVKAYSETKTVRSNDASVAVNTAFIYNDKTYLANQTVALTQGVAEYEVVATEYVVNPSDVDPLKIEYWITNRAVEPSDGTEYLTDSATNAENKAYSYYYSEIAVDFKEAILTTAGADISTIAPQTGSSNTVYWKSTVLTGTKQDNSGGNDQTMKGYDFTKIRYTTEWQFYGADGWKSFTGDYQVVAYYLQVTNVTTEVTTEVVDWGESHTTDYLHYLFNENNYAALDFQVVYPSGTKTPSGFPNDKTLLLHNNEGDGRTIGMIHVSENNPVFIVQEIQIVKGTAVGSRGSGGFSSVTYDESTAETVWTVDSGTDPILPSISFDENGSTNARLVRYILGVNPDYTNLKVHYINKNTGSEFHNYGIAAVEIAEDGSTSERDNFEGWVSASGQPQGTWQITNVLERTETVYYQVENFNVIPGMPSVYVGSDFKFSDAAVSADNKELYLYYTSERQEYVVVDFGVKVKMPEYTYANKQGEFGYIDGAGYYVPETVLMDADVFAGTKKVGTQTFTYAISVIPASNVLYEEGFFKGSGGSTTGHVDIQSEDQEVRYGYDAGYADADNDTTSGETFNGGVASVGAMTGQLTTSFYGHTFDLIGTCAQDSGIVYLIIKGNGLTKLTIIDTSYSQDTDFYQTPLAHVEMRNADKELVEGEYSVTVFGAYRAGVAGGASKTPAVSEADSTFVEIDGFRVYRSSANTAYMASEQNVEYQRALDLVQSGALQGVYVDDTTGNYSVGDYESEGGPQNEIYMPAGATVTFKIVDSDNNQISFRSVTGADITAEVSGEEIKIGHVTELYYPVTTADGVVTIENVSGGMLAVCNVKVAAGATFETVSEADMVSLFALLDVFVPERIDFQVRTLELYRRQSTTLIVTTSTDVAYLRINGRKIKPSNARLVKYGLADEYTFVLSKTTKVGEVASFEIVAYNAEGDESQSYYIED